MSSPESYSDRRSAAARCRALHVWTADEQLHARACVGVGDRSHMRANLPRSWVHHEGQDATASRMHPPGLIDGHAIAGAYCSHFPFGLLPPPHPYQPLALPAGRWRHRRWFNGPLRVERKCARRGEDRIHGQRQGHEGNRHWRCHAAACAPPLVMPRAEDVEADGTGGQGGIRRGTARRRLTTADAASLPRPQDLVLWSQPSWTLEDDRGIVETVEWLLAATGTCLSCKRRPRGSR